MTDAVSEPLLLLGDCLDRLREINDCSVDSVVTDPPYGLSFMGKKWDYDVPNEEIWRECLRVLKPGGHLLAFAGTRTQHRMAVRIEDAGFEIRDMIAWVYGSGFPKSLNVSKAIDKQAGIERQVVGTKMGQPGYSLAPSKGTGAVRFGGFGGDGDPRKEAEITAPATDAARQWGGWGTALKPALEPVTVARKPLGEKTVAANVLAHGTGAMNVDGCRVGTDESTARPCGPDSGHAAQFKGTQGKIRGSAAGLGRWPANLIHDGSEEVVGLFPETGASKSTPRNNGGFKSVAKGRELPHVTHGYDDNGGTAARFFYCAKASKKDRDEGLNGFAEKQMHTDGTGRNQAGFNSADRPAMQPRANVHPTVKPTALMRYLCRLVTPPEGIVLDPFMGSGSTGKAAVLEGFQFIGIERDEEYMKIAESRIAAAVKSAIAESA